MLFDQPDISSRRGEALTICFKEPSLESFKKQGIVRMKGSFDTLQESGEFGGDARQEKLFAIHTLLLESGQLCLTYIYTHILIH